MAAKERLFGEQAAGLFAIVLASPVLIGPLILALQGIEWLRSGQWPPVPISSGFRYFNIPMPRAEWVGVQKIIVVVMDFPLSLTVSVVWIGVIIFVVAQIEQHRMKKAVERNRYRSDQN